MADPELTRSQWEMLHGLPSRFPPERIDRLWIFPPRLGKKRESGLVVLSLFSEEEAGPRQRTLVTVRYVTDPMMGGLRRHERVAEEGRASPEQIDRVIAGVLARSGADSFDALVEPIEGRVERWLDLLDRLGRVHSSA